MKKIGIYILILSLMTAVANAQQVSTSEENLIEGILLLGEGNYRKAQQYFQQVVSVFPQQPEGHYFLAKSLMGLAELEKALESFGEAIRLNPSFQEAYLGKGICLYRLGRYSEALEVLGEAIKQKPECSQALFYSGLACCHLQDYTSCQRLLEKCRQLDSDFDQACRYYLKLTRNQKGKSEKKREELLPSEQEPAGESPWKFSFLLGVGYDDNVILQPEGEPLPAEISHKEDWQLTGQMSFGYHHGLGNGELGGSCSLYYTGYQCLSAYDILGSSVSLSYSLNRDFFLPAVEYRYEYFLVGSAKYLEKHSLAPSLVIGASSPVNVQVYFLGERTNFFPSFSTPQENRDSIAGCWGANLRLPAGKDGQLNMIAAYKVNKADGDNWDYRSPQLSLEFNNPFFSKNSSLNLVAAVERLFFDHTNTIFGAKRNDTRVTLGASLRFRLNRRWSLLASYTHMRNESSLEAYQYRRNISSLSVAGEF